MAIDLPVVNGRMSDSAIVKPNTTYKGDVLNEPLSNGNSRSSTPLSRAESSDSNNRWYEAYSRGSQSGSNSGSTQQLVNKNLILTLNGYSRSTLLRSTSPTSGLDHGRRPSLGALSSYRPRSANETAAERTVLRQLERSYSEADVSKIPDTTMTKEEVLEDLEKSKVLSKDFGLRIKNKELEPEVVLTRGSDVMSSGSCDCAELQDIKADDSETESETSESEECNHDQEETFRERTATVQESQQTIVASERKEQSQANEMNNTDKNNTCKIVIKIKPPQQAKRPEDTAGYQQNPPDEENEMDNTPTYGSIVTSQPRADERTKDRLYGEWANYEDDEFRPLIVSVEVEKPKSKGSCNCCSIPFFR
ncbi:uncharacterized protein LOC142336954 [Convolutriloba macropyga]|uniref:uncharacterized protein LOC142336954 n=1 Tax=Convolutriloba macropyga TaxID=536237 RepID=UPI003F51D3F9